MHTPLSASAITDPRRGSTRPRITSIARLLAAVAAWQRCRADRIAAHRAACDAAARVIADMRNRRDAGLPFKG